jgi:hypothetical protein
VKMDVTATIKRSAAIAIAIAGLIVVLLLFWIGGELHYRNCLEEVDLKHPVALKADTLQTTEREDAISDCSRWP